MGIFTPKYKIYKEETFSFEYPGHMSICIENSETVAFFKKQDTVGVLRMTRILPSTQATVAQLIDSMREPVKDKAQEVLFGKVRAIHWADTKLFIPADLSYWDEEKVNVNAQIQDPKLVWAIKISSLMQSEMIMHYWCFGINDVFYFFSYRTFQEWADTTDVIEEVKRIKLIFETIK